MNPILIGKAGGRKRCKVIPGVLIHTPARTRRQSLHQSWAVEPSHSTLPATLPVLQGNTECSALSKQHCFQRQFASVSFPVKGTISLALWVGCHPPTGCLPWSHPTCAPVLGAECCASKVSAQPFCCSLRVVEDGSKK